MQQRNNGQRRGREALAQAVIAPGLCLWACAASADEAPPPPADSPVPALAAAPASALAAPPPAPGAETAQLAEVVVTATKRRQSLRDIPASITSIPGEELAQRNAQDVQDIVKLVPGVNYSQNSVTPGHITIRGISAAPATGFTAGVLFGDVSFIDEYIPISSLDPNTFDLKSVDVLKGPQGTLFGASALNGAIRYVPNQPRYGLWQFDYYGNYGRYTDSGWKPSYGAVVNVPIGETLALRVMGFERDTPGWIDNTRTGVRDANRTNQDGARAILGWEPLDSLDVKLTYTWQNTHVADTSVASATDGSLVNAVNPRASPQRVNYSLLDLNAGYDLGFARLVSETATVHKASHLYSEASNRLEGFDPALLPDGSIPLLATVADGYSNTLSQELRLVSPEDSTAAWQWVAGVFGSRQHVVTDSDMPFGDSSIPISTLLPIVEQLLPGLAPGLISGDAPGGIINAEHGYADVEIREAALFADVTRRLWRGLELSLGGRLYDTNSSGSGQFSGPLVLAETGQAQQPRAGKVGQRGFNPKLSLAWHITPDLMTYAAAAKGFRVGGVQPGTSLPTEATPPAVFQSDSIWNYESGLRSQWLHRSLRLDLTAFYERWKHPQYQVPGSSGLDSFLTNVGGVKSQGVEAALQMALPLPGLLLSASGAYAHTVTTEPFANSDGSTAPVGTPWPFAPRWQTATTLAYIRDIRQWNVGTALTHTYLGKAANNLEQQSPVFGYQQWDANLNIQDQSRPWLPTLTVTVSNFLDARGVVDHNYMTSPNPYNDFTYIPPRQVTLRLSGHF